MKLRQILKEESSYSEERRKPHDIEVRRICEELAKAGLTGHVWMFRKKLSLEDSINGDFRVDNHKVDHKKTGRKGFFVSYNSTKNFIGEYYSTSVQYVEDEENGPAEWVFVDVKQNQLKARMNQAEKDGQLFTANRFTIPKEDYKKNRYKIYEKPTDTQPRDLGIRIPLSSVNFISFENFVKKMKDVS